MKIIKNVLYITQSQTRIEQLNEALKIIRPDETVKIVPVNSIESILCLTYAYVTPQAAALCFEKGIMISFVEPYGKYLGTFYSSAHGNILVRKQQYYFSDDANYVVQIVTPMIFAKITNSRTIINQFIRNHHMFSTQENHIKQVSAILKDFITQLLSLLKNKREYSWEDVNLIRGIEGQAANQYFSIFDYMILSNKDFFNFSERIKYPPTDAINSLLSFVYTLLEHDIRTAISCTSLDYQCGFLHRDRSGRPSLACDLMEEFRPWVGDGLVLSLINNKTILPDDFYKLNDNDRYSIRINEEAKKKILTKYHERKQDIITHKYLDNEKMTIAELFHVQANLLAMYIKNPQSISAYPPFIRV